MITAEQRAKADKAARDQLYTGNPKDTNKARVRALFPDAYAVISMHGWAIYTREPIHRWPRKPALGIGITEREAWHNAWQRLLTEET